MDKRSKRPSSSRPKKPTTQPAKGKRSEKQKPRQSVTPYALAMRLADSGVGDVVDTRVPHLLLHKASSLMFTLVMGLATAATSMRGIEFIRQWMSSGVCKLLDLDGPVSDTTLYEFLKLLNLADVATILSRLVKQEWKRGNLRPVNLLFSVVAFDGKQLIGYNNAQLWAMVRAGHQGTVPEGFGVDNMKIWMAANHPGVQVCDDGDGKAHGLLRSHRMTLVSNPGAPCLAMEVIPGHTNEVGHAPGFLRRALAPYRHTGIVEVVTGDAGNCSTMVEATIAECSCYSFLALKDNQPEALREARRLLDGPKRPADWQSEVEPQQGCRVVRRTWVADARGALERFPLAQQVVRVEREVTDRKGNLVSCESRYFVTTMPAASMTPRDAATVARYHWNCENLGHWTSDARFHEDNGARTPLTRNPEKVPVVAMLRLLAQSIVSILRSLARGATKKTPLPAWCETILQVLRSLWGGVRIRLTSEPIAFN